MLRLAPLLLAAATPPAMTLPIIDLSEPFATRAPWRFTATQGPETEDAGGNPAPGAIRVCVSRDNGRTCRPDLSAALRAGTPDLFSDPHYLEQLRVVRVPGGPPLLLVRLASLHSGDGDQRVATTLLRYDRINDRFDTVFTRQTGRNNDQEVRFVAAGPLAGAVIAAAPTADAPFAFWIDVQRPGPTGHYRTVLRYRSAMRYGDGNPLAVIDSEMPGILRRLHLRGRALQLRANTACLRPRLRRGELWGGGRGPN